MRLSFLILCTKTWYKLNLQCWFRYFCPRQHWHTFTQATWVSSYQKYLSKVKNGTELKKMESRSVLQLRTQKNWPEAKLQILKTRKIAKRSFFGKEVFFGDFENFDCYQDLTEKMQSPRLDGIQLEKWPVLAPRVKGSNATNRCRVKYFKDEQK